MTPDVRKEIREVCELYQDFCGDPMVRVRAQLRAAHRLIKLWPRIDPMGSRNDQVPPKMRRAIAAYNLAARASTLGEQEAAALAALRSVQAYLESFGVKLPDIDQALSAPKKTVRNPNFDAFINALRSVAGKYVEIQTHDGDDKIVAPGRISYGIRYDGCRAGAHAARAELESILVALGVRPDQAASIAALVREVYEGSQTAPPKSAKVFSVSASASAAKRLEAFRRGETPYQQKMGALFRLLLSRQGEVLAISELGRAVGTPDAWRMCRQFQADGEVNGGWMVEFPARGKVIFRAGR